MDRVSPARGSSSPMMSQVSDSADLLELSNKLDEYTSALKRQTLESFQVAQASLAAQHAQDRAALIAQHEKEKADLVAQREECRQYWYQNRARVEELEGQLAHRTSQFALAVAARPMHSVWWRSPELQHRAQSTELHKYTMKRVTLTAWRKWARDRKNAKAVERHIQRQADDRAKRRCFYGWRCVAAREAASKRSDRLTVQYETRLNACATDHMTEVHRLRAEVETLTKQLEEEAAHRGTLEERLKIAFMRGVCALNLEAMQVIRSDGLSDGKAGSPQDGGEHRSAAPQASVIDTTQTSIAADDAAQPTGSDVYPPHLPPQPTIHSSPTRSQPTLYTDHACEIPPSSLRPSVQAVPPGTARAWSISTSGLPPTAQLVQGRHEGVLSYVGTARSHPAQAKGGGGGAGKEVASRQRPKGAGYLSHQGLTERPVNVTATSSRPPMAGASASPKGTLAVRGEAHAVRRPVLPH